MSSPDPVRPDPHDRTPPTPEPMRPGAGRSANGSSEPGLPGLPPPPPFEPDAELIGYMEKRREPAPVAAVPAPRASTAD